MLLAVGTGEYNSINFLDDYYKTIEKNYYQMKKYYLLAIDHGNISAMCGLGCYYQMIEKDYDQMKNIIYWQ